MDPNEIPNRSVSSLGDGDTVAEMLSESSITSGRSAHAEIPPARPFMQNRELSWLIFNQRVLDQGTDETVPLLDRLKFVSIFSSNLAEFFMVRVGSLTDLSFVKRRIIDTKSNMTPSEQLDAIYERCHELYPIREEIYFHIREQLKHHGLINITGEDLTPKQDAFLRDHLDCNVMPFLSPQIINARHPFPHLENGALYVVVRLDETRNPDGKKIPKDDKDTKRPKNLGADGATLGIIPMPQQCKRVIKLPGEGFTFILIEHALKLIAPDIFSMYTVKHTNIICVTRNADLDANDDPDELDEDYREHMKRILKKRTRLAPVRLESERELSRTVSDFLLHRLNLKPHQVFVTKTPLDMTYCSELASYIDKGVSEPFLSTPFEPQWPLTIDRNRSLIEQVSTRSFLLFYPYDSMNPFIQLLREAASDPDVISIKITLYRLASQSHLAEALIAAAEAGKDVTALFELRARFDENNNIMWSQRFEQAGAKVIYGFKNHKVHSKICCITRQTEHGIQSITQLGTGNYNEKTARLYTDLCYITTDEAFGRDGAEFFRNMGLENISANYETLWVAPLLIKQRILAGIDREIELSRAGEPSGLFFKTNSVTDKDIIEKLAEASQAGVPVTLFVRGISCILPGIEGFTENVRVVSIIGRLLEHSRIYGFGSRESMSLFLSSADLMTRNMEKRVEIAWPVRDEELRSQLLDYIDISMRDTAKLRELLPDKSYTPLWYFAKVDEEGNPELFDSQEYLIRMAQERYEISVIEAESSGKNLPETEVSGTEIVLVEKPRRKGFFGWLSRLFKR